MPHDGDTTFSKFSSYGSGRRSPSGIKIRDVVSSSSLNVLSKKAKEHAEAYTRYDESEKSTTKEADYKLTKKEDYKLTTTKDKT